MLSGSGRRFNKTCREIGAMIRELTINDLASPDLIELARTFYNEGRIPGKFIPEVFKANWTNFINNGCGVIYGQYIEGKLIGAIGGLVYPDPNDGVLVANENFWFVKNKARGNGIKLFYKFEYWVKLQGAKRLIMVYLQNSMPDKMEQIYRKMKFKKLETHYWKEI
jgi:pentatricopeptide repeat protein